jgi:hypothetical protein
VRAGPRSGAALQRRAGCVRMLVFGAAWRNAGRPVCGARAASAGEGCEYSRGGVGSRGRRAAGGAGRGDASCMHKAACRPRSTRRGGAAARTHAFLRESLLCMLCDPRVCGVGREKRATPTFFAAPCTTQTQRSVLFSGHRKCARGRGPRRGQSRRSLACQRAAVGCVLGQGGGTPAGKQRGRAQRRPRGPAERGQPGRTMGAPGAGRRAARDCWSGRVHWARPGGGLLGALERTTRGVGAPSGCGLWASPTLSGDGAP